MKTLKDYANALKGKRTPFKVNSEEQGNIGYDNARENIDPRIVTNALITKTISGMIIDATAVRTNNLSVSPGVISGANVTSGADPGHTHTSTSAPGTVTSVFTRTGAVIAATNDYTWAQVNKATSSIADITTKSHTALTDIGTNTHTQIDTHIAGTGTAVHGDSYLLNTTDTGTGFYTFSSNTPAITLSGTAHQISLTNATSNSIRYGAAGVAAPTATSYSAGVKLILYDNISASLAGYAVGVENNNMWFGIDNTPLAGKGFKWYYGGATPTTAMALDNTNLIVWGNLSGSLLYLKNNTGGDPATPTNAGVLFVSGGLLWYKGTSGTRTKLAPA